MTITNQGSIKEMLQAGIIQYKCYGCGFLIRVKPEVNETVMTMIMHVK